MRKFADFATLFLFPDFPHLCYLRTCSLHSPSEVMNFSTTDFENLNLNDSIHIELLYTPENRSVLQWAVHWELGMMFFEENQMIRALQTLGPRAEGEPIPGPGAWALP